MNIQELAEQTLAQVRALGADEATVGVGRSSEASLMRRNHVIEQATQAQSLSLSLTLLVDDRYSAHSTSDLRPEAVQRFLERAVAATRVLEPEPERRQPDLALCGRGIGEDVLDQHDPVSLTLTGAERRDTTEALEAAVDALADRSRIKSATIHLGDSFGESVRVMSNGFSGRHVWSGFGMGVEMTLEEPGGRRPEAMSWASATHRGDLPEIGWFATEAWRKAERRIGSGPAASGRYTMILEANAVPRLLGVIAGPISGSELHQGRSCLAGKLDTAIAASSFSLLDDPFIPRGLSSRPYDGEGLRARPMPVIEAGILKNYYINTYYGRKLGVAPTTGSRSNWVIPPGSRSLDALIGGVDKGIVVAGFLGGNSNGLTGDFSFGVYGLLVEGGVVTGRVSEMNVSGNITEILHRFVEAGNDVWRYSGVRTPSLVFDDVSFSGT